METKTILEIWFELSLFQSQLKLLHWAARNHARHMAIGELYDDVEDLIDEFSEIVISNNAKPTAESASKMTNFIINDNSDLTEKYLKEKLDFLAKMRVECTDAQKSVFDSLVSKIERCITKLNYYI